MPTSNISIANINRMIQSLPLRPGEFETAAWQNESFCAECINKIRARKDRLTASQWNDLEIATRFVCYKWPSMDERPRSSIEMTWAGMADKFLFSPFNRLFSGGKCTFLPEHVTHAAKIVICDFPLLEYGHETGRLINCLIKIAFQRAWLRRDVTQHPNLAFLWQDEFQYFVLPRGRDNAFQQTCRSARIAVVCISQNILNLSEELGEHAPGSKTKAFLGNLMLKVSHQQNDTDTNQYAADLIGKEYRYLRSTGVSSQDATFGRNEQLLYKVTPDTFTQLQKPNTQHPLAQAIVYAGGSVFNATRTKDCPEGRNYLSAAFSR